MDDALSPRERPALALTIDRRLYSDRAVLKACYRFTDRAHCSICRDDGDLLRVDIRPKSVSVDLSTLEGDFVNELIDQQLRDQLETEVGPVRALIVAQAFAEGNLLDPDRDDGDHERDPLGITGAR